MRVRLSRTLHRMASSSQASSSKAALAWEQDPRGYPERTFPTRILRVESSSISFKGEGREPYQRADHYLEKGSESESSIAAASRALSSSHLVAFPTETVYGLGANALDPDAALKIFRAKGRPVDNPLIVHISDMQMLRKLVADDYQPGPVYTALMESFWPGAMTLLFPADEVKVPSVVRCGLKTVGIRMPSHPVARALIAASGLPLAAPSANVSGRPSPTTAMHVYSDMTTK
jgi:L-threonylcarbamoyladenylate synthase